MYKIVAHGVPPPPTLSEEPPPSCPHTSHCGRSFWQRLLWTAPCRLARTFSPSFDPSHGPFTPIRVLLAYRPDARRGVRYLVCKRDAEILYSLCTRVFLANCNNSRGPSAVCHENPVARRYLYIAHYTASIPARVLLQYNMPTSLRQPRARHPPTRMST